MKKLRLSLVPLLAMSALIPLTADAGVLKRVFADEFGAVW